MGWSNNAFFKVIIVSGSTGSGVFAYSPKPAFGNLIASIVATPGTDPYGNAYVAGVTSYTNAGQAASLSTGELILWTAPGAGGPWVIQATLSFIAGINLHAGVGTGNPINIAADTGQTINFQTAALALLGLTINNGLTWTGGAVGDTLALSAHATPAPVAGEILLFADSVTAQPWYRNPQGLQLRLSASRTASATVNTVTQAALTALLSDTIPANDAEAGATYQFEAFGFGSWGATQQALTLAIRFGATAATVIGNSTVIAATALAAGASFAWNAKITLSCVTSGASATWRASLSGSIQESANPVAPGTAATNSIAFSAGTSIDVTLDSTVAEILGLSAQWASTVGVPSITKQSSRFARVA